MGTTVKLRVDRALTRERLTIDEQPDLFIHWATISSSGRRKGNGRGRFHSFHHEAK